jgi:hypothetical protein
MSRGSRLNRPIASDLLESGWLPPRAAAAKLGITRQQLDARADRGDIRRKSLAPGVWLYDVAAALRGGR